MTQRIINFVRQHYFLCYEDADSNGVVIEVPEYNCKTRECRIVKFVAHNISDARIILGY